MILECAPNRAGVRGPDPLTCADASVLAKQEPGFVLLTLGEAAEERKELARPELPSCTSSA
jgi:hypothetical protein